MVHWWEKQNLHLRSLLAPWLLDEAVRVTAAFGPLPTLRLYSIRGNGSHDATRRSSVWNCR
jgi:hypothetical protein